MSSYVKPDTLQPSQVTSDRLSKVPVGNRPDGTASTSLFKTQVLNSQNRAQDVVLQIGGSIASSIGYWDNATDAYVRDLTDLNAIPLATTTVNLSVGIESARLYGTPDATETSSQDLATYEAIRSLQKFNTINATPAIYEKMPYLPKGTIEASLDSFAGSILIGEPLVRPDGSKVAPYKIDEKTGRQYLEWLAVSVQLYLKPRVAGKPAEVDNAILWEIVGWEDTPSGGKKPILEPSKDWLGLLRWGAKGVVKGKMSAVSLSKENKVSCKFVGSEFFFERSQRGGAQIETDPNAAAAALVWG